MTWPSRCRDVTFPFPGLDITQVHRPPIADLGSSIESLGTPTPPPRAHAGWGSEPRLDRDPSQPVMRVAAAGGGGGGGGGGADLSSVQMVDEMLEEMLDDVLGMDEIQVDPYQVM